MGSKNPLTGGIESDYELNKQNADMIQKQAQFEAVQRRKQADIIMGEQIAAFGASGVELSGTAAALIQSDQVNAEIEAMNIIYSGNYQKAEMRARAKNQKNQAYLGLATSALSLGLSSGAFKGAGVNSSGGGSPTLNEVNQGRTSAMNYSGGSNRNLS